MSTFDHSGLIQNVTQNLAGLRKARPEVMQAFGQLSRAALADGVISEKHKELIALAIGITQHCSACIGFHVRSLRRLGCSREELDEMLAVCVYMGGGPALMYASEACAAWDSLGSDPG